MRYAASTMETLPMRLTPGQDLRRVLEEKLVTTGGEGAFVLAGIGSLSEARLRLAGAAEPRPLRGDFEILTLSGTVSLDGAHLHMSVADATGAVLGGHVSYGCLVRTTAEVLLALLPDWSLRREPDSRSGYDELVVRHRGA